MNSTIIRSIICSLILLVLSTSAFAAGLELGDSAGPLDLLTSDGRPLKMNNYAEQKATAIVFLSPRCPVTRKTIREIVELHDKYRRDDVFYVGVVSGEDISGEELTRFVQSRGVIIPLYRDPSGKIAKRFGATVTPELFLLDTGGKLIFHSGLKTEKERETLSGIAEDIIAKKPIEQRFLPADGTPIDRQLSRPSYEDPYGSLSFSSELIFDRIPGAPAHHCSSLAQAPNGDLVSVWYGGSYESAEDQKLFFARRPVGTRTWSSPVVLQQDTLQPPGNAVIFVDNRSRLWIVWCRMEESRPLRRGGGWVYCRLMYRISTDSGQTWTADKPMFDKQVYGVPRNGPITLRDGTFILPIKNHDDNTMCLVTTDDGQSWQRRGPVSTGSQPAIIERSDGSLMALLRHRPHILSSLSHDAGRTWTEPHPLPLKNPGAGITLTKLKNGHLVLVFNDSESERTPLSITRSLDEGRTWQTPLHLESNPGEYSYPSIIQSTDGKIHLTYTFRRYAIKHVEMNEDWLIHTKRPN